MHPKFVRAHVEESVAELEARLASRPELGVVGVNLDLDAHLLDVMFDHDEHQMELWPITSPVLLPGGRQMTRHQRIPILGQTAVHRRVLRLGLDDFDLQPPTAELLDEQLEPLPATQWPTSVAGGGIVNDHPVYKRPFFCRRGLREFHIHEQHEDDPWVRWRDALPLHAIVIELLADLRIRWLGAA